MLISNTELEARIKDAWDALLNKDDRNSPADYPEMCLITREELGEYMADAAFVERAPDDAYLLADHSDAWNVAHFKRAVSNLARGYIELRELLSNLVNGSAVPQIAIDRMRVISHSNDI